MSENILFDKTVFDEENEMLPFDFVNLVSERFERDCRRYNRTLTDDKEAGTI